MNIDKELQKLPVEGYIWLHIRALNNDANLETFAEFKEFAKKHCDDNYTQALRTLIDYKKADYKYAMFDERISKTEQAIEHLGQREDKDEGTF